MIKKILKRFFLAIFILILFSLVLVRIPEVKLLIFSSIANSVEKKTGYTIQATEVDIDFPFQLKFNHLKIRNQQNDILTADHAIFEIIPSLFINKKLHFRRVKLDGAVLYTDFNSRTSDFSNNFLDLTPFYLKIDDFTLNHLKIHTTSSSNFKDATIDLNGKIKVDPRVKSINLQVKAQNSNCEHQFAFLETLIFQNSSKNILEGEMTSTFSFGDTELQKGNFYTNFDLSSDYHLQLFNLAGHVDQIDFAGKVGIRDSLAIDGTHLAFSINQIEKYQPFIDHLYNLSFLQSEFKGNLEGCFTAEGHLYSPRIKIEARSEEITLAEQSFKNLLLSVLFQRHNEIIQGGYFFHLNKNNEKIETEGNYLLNFNQTVELTCDTLYHPYGNAYASLTYNLLDHILEGEIKGKLKDLSQFNQTNSLPLKGNIDFSATIRYTEKDKQIFHVDINSSDLTIKDHPIDFLALSSTISQMSTMWPINLKIAEKNVSLKSHGLWGLPALHTEVNLLQLYESLLKNDSFEKIVFDIQQIDGLKGSETFYLKDPFLVQIQNDSLKVDPVKLTISDGWLQTSFDYSKTHFKSHIELYHLPLAFILQEVYSEPIDGIVSGQGEIYEVEGHLQGEMQTEISGMTFKNELIGTALPLNSSLSIKLSDSALNLHSQTDSNDIPNATFSATIPLQATLRPFQFEIEKDKNISGRFQTSGSITPLIELFALEDFIITGDNDTEISISGTLNHPQISGRVEIHHGTIESFALGTMINDIEAVFEGDQNGISMEAFSANDSAGGRIEGTGTVSFSSNEANTSSSLHFDIENFQILKTDLLKGSFNGAIDMAGNLEKIHIQGNLDAVKMEYSLSQKADDFSESLDVIYVNQSEDEPPPTIYRQSKIEFIPITMDIKINIPGTLTVNDSDLHSQWKGDIVLGGKPEKFSLKGDLSLTKGDYILNGQQFDLSGNVAFAGDVEKKTTVYMVASRNINEYRVDIVLQGNVTNPNIILRSSPSLPQQEVLSLILFGRSPAEISAVEDQQLEKSLSSLLKEHSDPGVMGKVQKSIGIDRIDFNRPDYDRNEDMSIQFGKYITRNIYISLNKGFGDEPTRVALEAKLKNEFKLQIDAGESSKSSDNASGQISLLWKHDY